MWDQLCGQKMGVVVNRFVHNASDRVPGPLPLNDDAVGMPRRRLWWRYLLSVLLFDRVGKGALLIGSPIKLVVRGPYQRVRNPMGIGVFSVLLGTTVATASLWLLGWFAVLCAAVPTLVVTAEEPYLRRRFGAEHEDYRWHVPRWIPRTTAWEPSRPS